VGIGILTVLVLFPASSFSTSTIVPLTLIYSIILGSPPTEVISSILSSNVSTLAAALSAVCFTGASSSLVAYLASAAVPC
jgi:hypothetical protein